MDNGNGRVIKGYVLLEPLGAGGFGTVYRATQPGIGRDVALKIIQPTYADEPEFIRRFEAEAQIVARLEHPHIVPLYDYWRDPSGAYLVMRWIRGGSVQQALHQGPLALDLTTRLLDQIGAALTVAHRQGVVHRDLKPANLLLDDDQNAYLTDFGIAKRTGALQATVQTVPGALVGSPAYISPEQIKAEPVTPQTDIYSLGVTLYEILTGVRPFQDPTPYDLIFRHLHEPLPSLRGRRPDLPPALDALIARATAKDPAERYPDILSLVREFHRIVAPEQAVTPAGPPAPTGLVTFLLTDIEGSTKRWEHFPAAMPAALARHDMLVRQAIAAQGGVVIQTAGDSFLAAFPSAVLALNAALAAQHGLRTMAWEEPVGPLRVRMGLHSGPAERQGGEYHAEYTLNRLARLTAAGHGGQVLLSGETRALLDPPPAGVQFRDLGARRLKDLSAPLPVFQIVAPGLPDQFPPLRSLDQAAIATLPIIDQAIAVAGDLPEVPNPYKGLRAFQEADAADFFGRASLTARVLARLNEADPLARFLAVVGPSGSGKSSAVAAGLLPALRHGGLPGSERWFIVEMIPGPHPLEELEAALLRVAVNPPASLREQLQTDERGLARAVKRVLPGDFETELVLVIDQFEEVFTVVADEAERVGFLRNLYAAVTDPRSRLRVILTLRADFYDRPLLYAEPGELIRQRTEVVLPLTAAELEQAICSPAERVGVHLEPELVATIIQEVGDQPGTLPLLQYALTELFEQREDGRLTLAAYRAGGGVLGALARRADELYTGLTPQEQEVARQVFLRLVTLGEGTEDTRRRVRRGELAALGGDRAALDTVLERYSRWRLLTFDRDPITREPTVELAHEALLRSWSRLRDWLDGSRADLRVQRQLLAASQEWAAAGQDDSFLARGARLASFATLAAGSQVALTAEEQAYLAASEAERTRQAAAEQERQVHELALAQQAALAAQQAAAAQRVAAHRLRNLVGALAGFLVVALGLAAFALNQSRVADQQQQVAERQARVARAQALAAEAVNQDRAPELGVLLAMEAVSTTQRAGEPAVPQAVSALHLAVARSQLRRTLRGHTAGVWGLAVSPDGSTIATGGVDNTVRLWDAATGQPRATLSGHTAGIWSIAFSPDGRRLLTASDDKTVRLWDLATGRTVLTLPGQEAEGWSAAYSPDGRWIVTATGDNLAKVWDATTGQLHATLSGHTDLVISTAFSPDSRTIVTGGADKVIRVWDVATGQPLQTLEGHTNRVTSVAFSPDGRSIVSSSWDRTARVWNVGGGPARLVLQGHSDGVIGVTYSPNGASILTASDDKTARVWDAATGQEQFTLHGHTGRVRRAVYSPDGRQIITSSEDGTARVWDAQPLYEAPTLRGHTDQIVIVQYSPDGSHIATASVDGTAKVWEAATGRVTATLAGHTAGVNSVAYSPDGKRIVTASDDKTARVWDAATGQLLQTLQGHTGGVTYALYSPDGLHIVTGSYDTTARIWDARTGQTQLTLKGHSQTIWNAVYSADGRRLVTADADGTARLWDAATGQALGSLPGPSSGVGNAVFTLDGTRIITADGDGVLGIWDAASARRLFALRDPARASLGHIELSRDGQTVAASYGDGLAEIWDIATGRARTTMRGHTAGVTWITYSPDGRTVATAGEDGTARIWDVATGQEVTTLTGHTDILTDLAYSPDGRFLTTVSADGTGRQYYVHLDDLLALARTRVTRDLTPEERATYLGEPLPALPVPTGTVVP